MSWLTKSPCATVPSSAWRCWPCCSSGAYAITSLKQELIPDLTFPYLTVFTVDQGPRRRTSSARVTTPLEQAIKATNGVKEYDSFSNDGVEHHHRAVRVRRGHEGQAGRDPAGRVRGAGHAALHRAAAAGRGAQLQQHARGAARGVVGAAAGAARGAPRHARRAPPAGHRRRPGGHALRCAADAARGAARPQEGRRARRLPHRRSHGASRRPTCTTGAGTVSSGSLVYPVTVSATARP